MFYLYLRNTQKNDSKACFVEQPQQTLKFIRAFIPNEQQSSYGKSLRAHTSILRYALESTGISI